MSDYINHILSRHTEPGNNVKPRVRGRFEPIHSAVEIYSADNPFEQDVSHGNTPRFPVQKPGISHTTSGDKSAASGEEPQDIWPSLSKANHELRNESVKSTPSASPQQAEVGDQPKIQERKRISFQEITATPVFRTAGVRIDPAAFVPLHRDTALGSREENRAKFELFKSNEDNKTDRETGDNKPAGKALDGSGQPAILSENHFSYLERTMKPAVMKAELAGAEFQSSSNGLMALPGEPQRLRDFNQTFDQHVNNAGQPVIKVTIGRIDVRAVVEATPPPIKSKTVTKPKLSLEDYLKQRNNSPS